MRETKAHRDAFNTYYLMGADRSLVSVADQCNVSERTVARWSKAFSWQERITLKDIDLSRKIEEKVDDAVVNTRADYRKMIKDRLTEVKLEKGYLTKAYSSAKKKLDEGTLGVESIKDLTELSRAMQGMYREERELMKLDMVMMGEADSHTQLSGDSITFQFGGKISEDDL